ncbi:MAG: acyltransferase [Actinobacteria bacterium]|nr:acyltransferase [Actinomycetota bacterium]
MNQLSSLQNSETTRFRHDIQLLRAIAILFVVLNHIDFAFLSVPAGYRGVDVFFVVSGFVIMSSILRHESVRKGFSLLTFFKRRAQRLYPAFLVVIICVFVVSFITQSFIHVQQETARTGVGASLFFANYVLLARKIDYFNPLYPNPLTHTWSLSVEEQFYITLGILFILMKKFRMSLSGLFAMVIVAVLAALSLYSCFNFRNLPDAQRFFPNPDLFPFYSFHSRAWQLLAGVFVAQIIQRLPNKRLKFQVNIAKVVATVSFLGILRGLIAGAQEHQLGIDALIITLSTALFIFSMPLALRNSKLLGLPKIISWLGSRSYSLYLVHWPIILFGRQIFGTSTTLKILCLVLSIISSEFLFSKVEYRYHDRDGGQNRNILKLFAIGQISTLCLMAALMGFGNLRYNQTQAYPAWEKIPAGCTGPVMNCDIDFPNSNGLVLLEGNSHAGSIVHTFIKITQELKISSRVTANGSKVLSDGTELFNSEHFSIFSYFRDPYSDKIEKSYAEHWERYLQNPKVKNLIVFLDNPYMQGSRFPSLISGPADQSRSRSEQLRNNLRLTYLRELQKKYINLIIVDPFDSLCDQETCFGGKNGKVWYLDEDHLTVSGGAQLESVLRKTLITTQN